MNQNNISLKKVIEGLECISGGVKQSCRDCEYSKREEWCVEECAKDALALLKDLNEKLEETQRAYESALMIAAFYDDCMRR